MYSAGCSVAPHSTVKGKRWPEREQFLDGPDVIGPASGHGRGPLVPLPPLLLLDTETAMLLAEVVDTPHQIHPFFQRLLPVRQRSAASDQRRQAGAECRVQPLDVRRVDLLARVGPLQLLFDFFAAA